MLLDRNTTSAREGSGSRMGGKGILDLFHEAGLDLVGLRHDGCVGNSKGTKDQTCSVSVESLESMKSRGDPVQVQTIPICPLRRLRSAECLLDSPRATRSVSEASHLKNGRMQLAHCETAYPRITWILTKGALLRRPSLIASKSSCVVPQYLIVALSEVT
jgi:hypothetical protein